MFNINSTLSRRNFLAGAAALGSTAALAGCSSGGSDGGSADDGKTFKIGVIGPLTRHHRCCRRRLGRDCRRYAHGHAFGLVARRDQG
ncbi:twin-arginine translocation signal domain-containing protein [Collinsella aerofaciens]|uniref:twin-arginine translocation signal domain-containing protein n=1 Tax=Collinsella aerofaciens TaxID=74426 RepID=UPI002FE46F71